MLSKILIKDPKTPSTITEEKQLFPKHEHRDGMFDPDDSGIVQMTFESSRSDRFYQLIEKMQGFYREQLKAPDYTPKQNMYTGSLFMRFYRPTTSIHFRYI